MAASLRNLCKKLVSRKLLSYGKKLQVASKTISTLNNKACIRVFSSSERSGKNSSGNTKLIPEIGSGWPDELLGPVTPANQKFPLPGNTSVSLPKYSDEVTYTNNQSDFLDNLSYIEKHLGALGHFIAESKLFENEDEIHINMEIVEDGSDVSDQIIRRYLNDATVEVCAQKCPKILFEDFKQIFLDMPAASLNEKITVITVTQKSSNDMSTWSHEVSNEREQLMKCFVETATEVCHLLRANNYWSDFIDPASGCAYFGSNSNATMTETNDNYESLGFTIDDLGCCKVITHPQWGNNVFVGSVITNATVTDDIIDKLLKAVKTEEP